MKKCICGHHEDCHFEPFEGARLNCVEEGCRCREFQSEIDFDYWVVRIGKEYASEAPFKALSREHAERWIDQPICRGKFRIVLHKPIFCDRCSQIIPFSPKDMEALIVMPDEEGMGNENSLC